MENIEKLRDAAKQPGNEGAENKKAYNELLKDLGLRPHGTRIEGGTTRTDDLRGVRDAGSDGAAGRVGRNHAAILAIDC